MHFPLRKGAEVLLTFIGGDPDRPVIAGSIPNASQPSVVNADNHTNSMIKTGSGNKIEMEDKEGKNRIKLETGDGRSYFHIGAPNHDGDGFVSISDGMERKEIIGGQQILIAASGASYEDNAGTEHTIQVRDDTAARSTTDIIDEQAMFSFAKKDDAGVGSALFLRATELTGENLFERRVGDKYLWTAGNEYIYGGGNVFEFGNGYTEIHAADDIKGTWSHPTTISGADNYSPDDNLVEKVWADTISYQSGNNYAWGDTAEYNFGNGYEENHMEEDNKINSGDWSKDEVTSGGPSHGDINGSDVKLNEKKGVWVTKSIGDAYDYTKGDSIEVIVGDTESKTYGRATSYHTGDMWDEVDGDSTSVYNGSVMERFVGTVGTYNLAATNEMNLAATNTMTLAASSDIFVGIANNMCFGAWTDISAGAKIEIGLGAKCEIESVADLKTKMTEIKTAVNAVDSAASRITANATRIDSMAAHIRTAASKISTGVVTLFS